MKRFNPFGSRDPLVVTMLPTASLVSEQELLDAEVLMRFNRNVAENIRTKAPVRQKMMADKRLKWAEQQSLTYLRQAS